MSWDIHLQTVVDAHEIDFGREFNYTHNTNQMVREAGFTEFPYEVDKMNAGVFCERLFAAIEALRADPHRFRAMNPDNGWGTLDGLVGVLTEMHDAYDPYPSAIVRCWA